VTLARAGPLAAQAGGESDTTYVDFVIVWKRDPDGRLRIYLDLYN